MLRIFIPSQGIYKTPFTVNRLGGLDSNLHLLGIASSFTWPHIRHFSLGNIACVVVVIDVSDYENAKVG